MWNIGPKEILIIALIGFFLYGGKRLSEMARNLGQTTKDFKDARKELNRALDETSGSVRETLAATDTEPKAAPQPKPEVPTPPPANPK